MLPPLSVRLLGSYKLLNLCSDGVSAKHLVSPISDLRRLSLPSGFLLLKRPKNYGGNYGFGSSKSTFFQKVSLTLASTLIYANILNAR
jgi:hypothetical protein